MDNTINTIEMCAGYGGIGLGLKRIFGERLRTIAYCELEGFAQANLISKMEKGFLDVAPIWSDLKSFPYGKFHGLVDILIAGYPCQPFSNAGKRGGQDDPRHLWPWIADGIRVLRPRMCFFENVEGHISLGLREVIGELEEIGYKTAWGIFSAAVDAGAPHQRKRVFILAHLCSEGLQGREWIRQTGEEGQPCGHIAKCGSATSWPSRPGEPQHAWEPPRVVGNAELRRCESRNVNWQTAKKPRTGCDQLGNAIRDAGVDVCGTQCTQAKQSIASDSGSLVNAESEQGSSRDHRGESAATSNTQQVESGGGDCGSLRDCDRKTQPSLGRNPHGSTDWVDYAELCVSCDSRTDELRLLGNGVVPSTAERAFRILIRELL